MSLAFVYIYNKALDSDILLPDNIINHCNKKKVLEKRNISISNYYKMSIKLKELFNIDISDLEFIDNKPIIKGCYISLSHTDKYYGFIISKEKVGIDIENIIANEKLAKRILDSNEYKEYEKNPIILTEKWCLLECYYKMIGNMNIDKNKYKKTFVKRLDDSILVAIGNYDNIKIFINDTEV